MSTNTQKVVVRIPPSPTGFFHVGRARTALFNYLFAKKHGGKVVFRLEDTDKERSKDEYAEDIVESLKWMGITYDEGPFKQSERTEVYKNYLHKMVDEGKAYISHEIEGENREVVRFKNPNKKITFHDLIRGDITFDTTDLKDFVLARNIDDPLYHLTVVVDDFDMGVTHVIRGDDGISNTPRQILIQEAIGAPRPIYAHVPLILAADKSKLSGRHGAVSIREYREKGYLPEALVNFLALLGWNPGTEQEIFSMEELIKTFEIERIQKGGAVFNEVKLKSINKHYIRNLPHGTLLKEISMRVPNCPEEMLEKIVPIILDRIEILTDIDTMNNAGDLEYFWNTPTVDPVKVVWKNDTPENTKLHLIKTEEILKAIDEKDFTIDAIKTVLMPYAEEAGKGNVLWPLRMALSGKDKSPDPFTILAIIGKHESLLRIHKVIDILP
jgi:glutamyl-tRNA synthetase